MGAESYPSAALNRNRTGRIPANAALRDRFAAAYDGQSQPNVPPIRNP